MTEQNTTEEKTSELVVVINQSGLEKETATTLLEKFAPLFEQAEEWKRKAESLVITDVSQKREMQEARVARLALKDIRVNADKTRKALKEDSLRYGKAVQGVYNVIEYLIAPIEKHLEEQEKFAEIQEQKRKEALKQERLELLYPYGVDHSFVDLANMPQDAFDNYLASTKKTYEDKIEAEQKAEQERIEAIRKEAEEREAQRKENERLKAEAEQREKELKAEREKAEAERKEQERVLAEERAKAEAERKEAERKAKEEREQAEAKAQKEREEQERILAQERAERQRVEDELKAKAEAERKSKEEEEARKEKELSAGDNEKFDSLMTDLTALKVKYVFKSKKHQGIQASANEMIDKMIAYLQNKNQ